MPKLKHKKGRPIGQEVASRLLRLALVAQRVLRFFPEALFAEREEHEVPHMGDEAEDDLLLIMRREELEIGFAVGRDLTSQKAAVRRLSRRHVPPP